ncbi:uncharacterized protein N7525_000856 [Penicillium rubens]|uniref:uncharacterized protein n=1 Tax=Penicillium rubens TaxID=1108849 RepID=UPI002A5A251D|nr:uncharacterized protein N7525_000856 [Penicillium rubens]KAJ5843115.1 hypothetical protein N7525_000856 [Penicillium rubens]KAJ5846303.1 hypothetical protein N7534_009972 [Penicillium rubens]
MPVPETTLINLDNDLQELICLKRGLRFYDETQTQLSIFYRNPVIRNLHIESWIQAKIKDESLHRSIIADFNRLPHDMKNLFVRTHRSTLQEPEFWALAIGVDTTFVGDGRSIIFED